MTANNGIDHRLHLSGAKTSWMLTALIGDDIRLLNSLRRHDPDQVWTVGAASAPSQPGAPDSREGQAHHNGNYPGSGKRAPDCTIGVNLWTRSASQSDVRWLARGHGGGPQAEFRQARAALSRPSPNSCAEPGSSLRPGPEHAVPDSMTLATASPWPL